MIDLLEFISLCLNLCTVCWANNNGCTSLSRNFVNIPTRNNTLFSNFSLWTKSGVDHSTSCASMCGQDEKCISFFYNARRDVCTAHGIQFFSNQTGIADPGSLYYTLPQSIDTGDCARVLRNNPNFKSGVYVLNPLDGEGPIRVYCDMTTDGGGWVVFQRRQDGSVDFFRDWADYKNGFGDLTGEFWLGNDHISRLTAASDVELRIDMLDHSSESGVAAYSTFKVGNETADYLLTVRGYSGDRGDMLITHNNKKFTTKDRDNDDIGNGNCALARGGAWWHSHCGTSNLNGIYGDKWYQGIFWRDWHGYTYSLKRTEMKMRPCNWP